MRQDKAAKATATKPASTKPAKKATGKADGAKQQKAAKPNSNGSQAPPERRNRRENNRAGAQSQIGGDGHSLPESVRSRLEAMSKENCVPFGELQAILLDYALESISHHGIRVPQIRGSNPPSPVCVMAKVRQADAIKITEKAHRHCADKEVMAGVFAEAGALTIRPVPDVRREIERVESELWLAINRDPENFTTHIPVFMPFEELEQATMDAENMNRDLGDWIGTLIMLGARRIDSEKFTTAMVGYRALEILCKANELEMLEETEEATRSRSVATVKPGHDGTGC